MRRFHLRTLMLAVVAAALALAGWREIGCSREAAWRSGCANNLKQIGLAIHNYASVHDVFPSGTVRNPALPVAQRLSWWVFVMDYVEQGINLVVDPSVAWNAGINAVPMFRHWNTDGVPPPYLAPAGNFPLAQCPSHPHPKNPAGPCATDYVGIAGVGTDAPTLPVGHPRAGFFGYDRLIGPGDIKDGMAYTTMVVETASTNGPWTAGGPATVRGVDLARRPYLGQVRQFGGIHPGGANVLFVDGSVRFLGDRTHSKVFEGFATIAGGEALGVYGPE